MPRMLVLPPQTSYNPKAIVTPVSKSRAKFCLHPIRKSASPPPRLLALALTPLSPLPPRSLLHRLSSLSLPPSRFFQHLVRRSSELGLAIVVVSIRVFSVGASPWCLKEAVAGTIVFLALLYCLFSLTLLRTRFFQHFAGFPELGFKIVGVSVRVFSVGASPWWLKEAVARIVLLLALLYCLSLRSFQRFAGSPVAGISNRRERL